MSRGRFGDWTRATLNATLQRASEPPMIVRLLTLAALSALCVAWVPAHPDALDDVEPVEAGPAIGEAQLAPYFSTPALKSALSELQADLRSEERRVGKECRSR